MSYELIRWKPVPQDRDMWTADFDGSEWHIVKHNNVLTVSRDEEPICCVDPNDRQRRVIRQFVDRRGVTNFMKRTRKNR